MESAPSFSDTKAEVTSFKETHKEVSTQTALNLEDLNTLLQIFLSPKQEACTQTDFSSDVTLMEESCGRCEGNQETTDTSTSLMQISVYPQQAIVKQEITSENEGNTTQACSPESKTPKSKSKMKAEQQCSTPQFTVPPSDRVTRSASRKKSVENVVKRTPGRPRKSPRTGDKSMSRYTKDNDENKKLTAVVKLEQMNDDDKDQFMCPECGETFSVASQLKRHAIEHADDSDIFACDMCSDAFDTKQELSKHKNAKHRTNFYCDICSKRFSSNRNLVKHIRTHTAEKPHQCDTCDLAFASEIELLDHTCTELNDSEAPKTSSKQLLHCIVCNKSFPGAYKLLRHYRSHTGEKPFQCSKCPRAFNDQYDLNRHLKAHNPDDPPSDVPLKTAVENKEICEMCGKVLRCKAHLIRHKMTHTGERPYACEHCDKRFTEHSGLKSHIARMHMSVEEKQHVCELCGKEFGILSHLNQHLKAHSREKVKKEKKPKPKPTCQICGKSFTQSYKLNIHMHKHRGTKPFCCDICGKGFLHRHDYLRHLQHQHSIGNNEAFSKRFPCDRCPKVFNKAFHLKRHFMVKHSGIRNFACNLCDKRYAMEEDLRQHMKTHTEGPYPCSVCGKMVATQRNLQRHMIVHENRPPIQVFKCADCNIGFFSQEDLDGHNQCHKEMNKCKCNFCEATFDQSVDLKQHRKSAHEKMSFPLNCEKCDKIFPTKYKIACHMKTHEKPLVCDLCGDRFSNQQVLRKHMISHTGIKPYVCEVCGKRFASPYHKKIHCRIHFEREFKCKLCNKGFTEKRSLEKHANVHLRPHQCTHCEKRFATIYHLQHHSARHTGHRPCKCMECDKTFIDMGDLNKHMKIHRKARYACNKCRRYFNTDTGLELHLKTHKFDTRFACSICNRKFKLQSHLEKHEKRHTDYDTLYIEEKVKPVPSTCSLVKCCLCGKNYGLKDGDEPFICKMCEKRQAEEHSVIILAMDQAIKLEKEEDEFILPVGGETTVVTENPDSVSEVYTEQELFKCSVCEKTFMLLENFLSHCEEHPEIEVTIETLETK